MFKNLTLITLLIVSLGYKCYGQVTVTYTIPQTPFIARTAIQQISPTITGGRTATSYEISPDFNANTGLDFNSTTGVISGIPTKVLNSVTYAITAHLSATAGDNVYTNIIIKINPPQQANSYKQSVGSFLIDSLIVPMAPLNGDTINTVYSIKKGENSTPEKLPEGLQLNPKTGAITGVPIKTSEIKSYTIIAKNITKDSILYPTIFYPISIAVAGYTDFVSKPATISFVGQGDIQQSLNSSSKIAANTGIGIVFRQNSSRRYGILHDIEIDFSINVASTVDTIRSINDKNNNVTNKQDFGNTVLLPASGQAFSFNFKGFFTERGGKTNGNYRRNAAPTSLLGVLSGFNISINGSNRNWEYVDYDTSVPHTLVKTSILSVYVGPFFEFITPKKSNNYGQNASITLGVGFSGRWILGDVQQGNNTDFRKELLGPSSRNSYMGPELALGLKFYSIKAEVHLPFFSNKYSSPGLSGSHLTTFIGFRGGFPLDLTKPNNQ